MGHIFNLLISVVICPVFVSICYQYAFRFLLYNIIHIFILDITGKLWYISIDEMSYCLCVISVDNVFAI